MKNFRRHLLDVYDAELYAACTRKAWEHLRAKADFVDPGTPEAAGLSKFALWVPKKGGLSVPVVALWIDRKAHGGNRALIAGTCAHEAAHAVTRLHEHFGIKDAPDNDEPRAYLTGWITTWLYDLVAP